MPKGSCFAELDVFLVYSVEPAHVRAVVGLVPDVEDVLYWTGEEAGARLLGVSALLEELEASLFSARISFNATCLLCDDDRTKG